MFHRENFFRMAGTTIALVVKTEITDGIPKIWQF
jgi:hypothetical protein